MRIVGNLRGQRESASRNQKGIKKNGKVACVEVDWIYQATYERCFEGEGSFVPTREGLIRYRFVKR